MHPRTEGYGSHVDPILERSCYDEGKRFAETLFFDYCRQHKLRIKVGRIFNTYGPNMHRNDGRVVSNFIIQALRSEPIILFGDASQSLSFCYVDDLVNAFVSLMETEGDVTWPIDLGNPNEFTIKELAETVIELAASKSELVTRPLPGDDPLQRQTAIDQARTALN